MRGTPSFSGFGEKNILGKCNNDVLPAGGNDHGVGAGPGDVDTVRKVVTGVLLFCVEFLHVPKQPGMEFQKHEVRLCLNQQLPIAAAAD